MRWPPVDTRRVCRRVVSVRTDFSPVNGAGGRLAGSVSCGIAVQVFTQCGPEGWWAVACGAVGRDLTRAVSADDVTTRASARTQVLIRVASGTRLGGFTVPFLYGVGWRVRAVLP